MIKPTLSTVLSLPFNRFKAWRKTYLERIVRQALLEVATELWSKEFDDFLWYGTNGKPKDTEEEGL